MTEAQWLRLAAELRARWPEATFSRASEVVYGRELADLDSQHVAAALAAHDRDGERFPPTAGQIRKRVVELAADAPDWSMVQRTIGRACSFSSRRFAVGEGFVDDRAAFLSEQHPLLAAFVERVGWAEAQWAAAGDVEDGRIAEAQVRTKWEQFRGRAMREAGLVGLPDGGLATLARVNREGGLSQLGAALSRALPAGHETVGGAPGEL